MRHGSAEPHSWEVEDFLRRLTPLGIKEVTETATKFLDQFSWLPERVLCSDAQRTQQTFEYLSKKMNLQLELNLYHSFYSGGPKEVLGEIEKVEDKILNLLIIGHNPTLSDLTSQLTGELLALHPADAVVLEKNCLSWAQAVNEQGWVLNKYFSNR